MKEFFKNQINDEQSLYIRLLQVTGTLSNLFADSDSPFLYYRAMENIFCKAFKSESISRSDVSADASKNKIGVGLKTFLHQNGNTFQKIAELNLSYLLRDFDKRDLIEKVAQMRNDRIEVTKNICNLDDMIYHLVIRHKGAMSIVE